MTAESTIDIEITGSLYDADTGAFIGPATPTQVWHSIDHAPGEDRFPIDAEGDPARPCATPVRRVYVGNPLLSVSWEQVEDCLGRPHDGSPADDQFLLASIIEAAGRDVSDCEGMLDPEGYHLLLGDAAKR